jgi:hypothetical protein
MSPSSLNPFATPDGSAAGGSVSGSVTKSPAAAVVRDSTTTDTSTQPTLRDFPRPPTKSMLRGGGGGGGRAPRAVAWSDKRSIASAKEKYTFYREGTPPPPEERDRITQPPLIAEELPYDYKYDHIAPPAPLPVAMVCGVRRRIFWLVLAAVLIVAALAIGIGVGVGVGANKSSSTTASDPQDGAQPTSTATIISTSTDSPTTTGPNRSSATSGSPTSKTSSASTISSNPAITTLSVCPAANNTIFSAPGTDREFLRICGVDYTGKNSAVDIAHVWTPTFEDCMVYCAGHDTCEACGWGILSDDPGSFHRCWLKRNVKGKPTTRNGWDFAIMRDT